MLDRRNPPADENLSETTEAWIGAFGAALERGSERALSELFAADSHWRNLFGISWDFATFSGQQRLVTALLQRVAQAGATGFRLDTAALTPRRAVVAGREVIEAIFAFDTDDGPGIGAIRLLPDADGRAAAWSISTSLDFNKICDARANAAAESHARDFAGPESSQQPQASGTYDNRDPDVLIVGGGHAGISAAVELKRIDLTPLIVDRMARGGANWPLRYPGHKLHKQTPANHP